MSKESDSALRPRGIATMPTLAACCGLAAVVGGLGLYTVERNQVRTLDQDRARTAAALDQAKLQIQDLTSRLNALAERSAAAEQATPPVVVRSAPAPRLRAASANHPKPRRAPAADARLDGLQGQLSDTRGQLAETQRRLADTQKELASTHDELARDKDELDGRINSTRNDLNSTRDDLNSTRKDLSGSIARTHDEVVALQRRGEQNIYEFTLTKSKDMQRVGPLSLSLRSTSTKHKTYDLAMVVDDNALSKKHVNLYEPVWITLGDRPQPVQLVVNHVEKNEIVGYVSEPKYKKSELAVHTVQPAPAPQPQLVTRDQNPPKN